MGGFIGASPKQPKPSPPVPEVDPEEEARKRRLEVQARNRRGRAGTIVTSPRGVLALRDSAPVRKSLLGE